MRTQKIHKLNVRVREMPERKTMTALDLPFPPSILNPNARPHWSPKATAKKKYRRDCYYLAKQVKPDFKEDKIYLEITFHPPDKRKRDKDNMIGAFKAGQDGIADAWNVDDCRFSTSYNIGDVVKYGKVCVEIK